MNQYYKEGIDFATYSPDGRYIITSGRGSDDERADIWQTTGQQVATLHQLTRIEFIGYSSDGRVIIAKTRIGIVIWDVSKLKAGGNFYVRR